MKKHFDPWSIFVIAVTLALFLTALAMKGLTHDLLVEAGVFLVSVKLIMMSYKNSIADAAIQKKLDEISAQLRNDNRPKS